jgi:multiple sugar transport system permease protein
MMPEGVILKKKKRKILQIIIFVVIGVVFIAYILPLLWMVMNTFKNDVQIFTTTPKFLFKPTLYNYFVVLGSDLFREPILVSLFMTITSTLLVLVVGTMAGYVFSRLKMRAKNDIMLLILLTRMMPPIVILIPVYIMYINIGLQDTFFGLLLIFTHLNLAFSVWMMKGFIDNIPFAYEEAAMCDGYSRIQVFFKLIMPMVVPGLLATAVFCGIFVWNEYIFARTLTWTKISMMTVKFYATSGGAGGVYSTISFLYSLPMIIFTFLIRKYLLRGVTFGLIKVSV